MIIGVDLDDVLKEFVGPFLGYYNHKKGTRWNKENITQYSFWNILGMTREEAIELVHGFYGTPEFCARRPIEGAIEGIDRLKEFGELVIVTGRAEYMEEMGWKEINELFPDKFRKIYSTNQFARDGYKHRKKSELCLEAKVSVLIDDSLSAAIDCASYDIEVLLFDQPWNQSKGLPGNVKRVYLWKEIVEEIVFWYVIGCFE